MPEPGASSYYARLGILPSASTQQIRRAYRELSKLYHPDTTTLPPAIAVEKFQQLNEAYATLSSPDLRRAYDLKMGYSRLYVIQTPVDLHATESRSRRSSAYLEPIERQLSPGELFALFILGVTFVACLLLVAAIGITRGSFAFSPLTQVSQLERSAPSAAAVSESTAAASAADSSFAAPDSSEAALPSEFDSSL